MNSSQPRLMNQAFASESLTQQGTLNSSLGDTVGSPMVHLGGQLLTVARLFAQMNLRSRRLPLSSIALGAPHLLRH
ncbi:hypothetical protein TNCV_4835581 [Trichonephila clavipes]|nr:hypothetical protein TNCV_4835581 [Trichonephila clavipes]